MTIASTSCRNNYVGNGATSTYPYAFPITLASDLLVKVQDLAGNVTTLILNASTGYTVDGVGKKNGGNVYLQVLMPADGVTYLVDTIIPYLLPSGYKLSIKRVRPLTQQTSIRNQGAYFAYIHENAFDNAIMVDQQLQAQMDSAVKLPDTVPPSSFDPSLPTNVVTPNAFLMTNPTGTGFVMSPFPNSPSSNIGAYATLKAQAALAPGQLFYGFATDIESFVAYCGDVTRGQDAGWTILGGL